MKNKYLNLYFNKINSSLFTIDEKIFHKIANLIKNLKKKIKSFLSAMVEALQLQTIVQQISVNF